MAKEMTREQVSAYIQENWIPLYGEELPDGTFEMPGKNLEGYCLEKIVDRVMACPCRKVRSEISSVLEWSCGLVRKSFIL